jgi:hypothetical protein
MSTSGWVRLNIYSRSVFPVELELNVAETCLQDHGFHDNGSRQTSLFLTTVQHASSRSTCILCLGHWYTRMPSPLSLADRAHIQLIAKLSHKSLGASWCSSVSAQVCLSLSLDYNNTRYTTAMSLPQSRRHHVRCNLSIQQNVCPISSYRVVCGLTEILLTTSLSLRIFSDGSGSMWKRSVKDIEGEILCVSQFTLMANTTKGNKPDFHRAMVSLDRHLASLFWKFFVLSSRRNPHESCTPLSWKCYGSPTKRTRSRVCC